MKIFLVLFMSLFLMKNVMAQTENNVVVQNYDVVTSFGSMCCGPASDDFLKDFIRSFNEKNKVTIDAWKLGGCGREGESKILISLANLKKVKKNKFITAIKNLIPQQNAKNKTVSASSGNIGLSYDVLLSSINNCRGQLVPFNLAKK